MTCTREINGVRGFPTYEFQNRLKKIQEEMITNDIDIILITTESNFHYFTGLISNFWESPTRPMYLLIDKHESPTVFVPTIMLESIKHTWIEKVYSWHAPCLKDDGLTLLLNYLQKQNCKKIGMSINIESQLRMPLMHLLKLKKQLKFDLIDISHIFQKIRLVKSKLEIAKIETICKIASKSFKELPSVLEQLDIPHVTERRAVNELQQLLLKNGADSIKYIVGKSGKSGYKSIVDGPGDDILLADSIFVIDTGAKFDGYFCDFDRNYIIQSKKSKINHNIFNESYYKLNKILWEATELAFKLAKPGIKFNQLWRVMVDHIIKNNKISTIEDYYNGRLGHSIGLQLTELPSIKHNNDLELQEGMVITLEPFITSDQTDNDKVIVHEEVIVITKNGSRMLSDRAKLTCDIINIDHEYGNLDFNVYNPLQKKNKITDETKQLLEEFDYKQTNCENFHKTIIHKPTPLRTMFKLESELGIGKILVKDEGERFGLKSFKALGASFAISNLHPLPSVLCTMTDGNHGKGVAFTAKKLGIKAVIYVPKNMTESRKQAMIDLGAKVITVEGTYDDAIEQVKEEAEKNNWCLVSDTSWDGYEKIPNDIVAGYGTIFREIEEQVHSNSLNSSIIDFKDVKPITHVIIQAGVGGLASAAAAYLELNKLRNNVWDNQVELIIVEPVDADCISYNIMKTRNNKNGDKLLTCVGKTDSIMAGLNCGTPSKSAWPMIRDIADLYITIGDEWAKIAMRKMHLENIISGESGAAGLAGLMALQKNTNIFDNNSTVLVINTEADTDPISYQKIIDNK
jgi:diaminopropionate ammonia-lyase family